MWLRLPNILEKGKTGQRKTIGEEGGLQLDPNEWGGVWMERGITGVREERPAGDRCI